MRFIRPTKYDIVLNGRNVLREWLLALCFPESSLFATLHYQQNRYADLAFRVNAGLTWNGCINVIFIVMMTVSLYNGV